MVMMKAGAATKKDGNDNSWALIKEVKRTLKLKVNSWPKDPKHIAQYPGAVGELPQWLQQRGYDPDDGPAWNELSLPDLTESKVALRSNSKLLTKNQQTQQTQVVPHEAASSSTGFDMGNPLAMGMLQMMNMMTANMQNMMVQLTAVFCYLCGNSNL